MAQSRSSFRARACLSGRLVGVDDRPDQPGLAARSVDLSRTGVGLVCEGWPGVGAVVRVALTDDADGHPVSRQWTGRVAHAREVPGGVRVGVVFDWPVGPGARTEAAVRGSRGPASLVTDGRAGPRVWPGAWAAPAVAAAGFAADQISKSWAASTGPGLDAWPGLLSVVPVENPGALACLAGGLPLTAPLCAAGGLVLAGLAVSRTRAVRGAAGVAGAGLIGAGLLGNSADRLALGYVRDFLVSGFFPRWSFNLADVFLVAGAVVLLTARAAGHDCEPADGV